MLTSLKIICVAFFIFLLGTFINDVFHYLLHKLLKSKYRFLRKIGMIHAVHHQFYTASLQINKKWLQKNLIQHVVVEYCIIILTIFFCLFFFDLRAVLLAAAFETIIFIYALSCRGIDVHHKPIKQMFSSRKMLFVNAEYHALHHIHPNSHYSSVIKLLDSLLGSRMSLKGKRISMTGANGALGSNMKKLLEKNGAIITTFKYGLDYTYEDYSKLETPLANTEILLLCHGSKYQNAQQANCDSFIEIIELFKKVGPRKMTPLEIWGVGSEIECHPCLGIKKLQVYSQSKRNYARKAYEYFHDPNIQYRHLVHSGFISKMGPGLMTASFAARMTVFLLKRDFKYVPVTYTGIAWINYLKFLFYK